MTLLTTGQMAQVLRLTNRGFLKLVHKMRLPYQHRGNRFLFDLEESRFEDFFTSIRLALTDPQLQAIYSLRDLATRMGRNKKTIQQLLIEQDIPTYHNGRKLIVLLIDLQKLQSRTIGSESRTSVPNRAKV